MVSKTDLPQSLITAIQYFSKMETCIDFVASERWPDGVTCPVCGNKDVHYLSKQRRWKCRKKHKLQQFSVKVGTIFEDSAIGLDKWLIAIWMIVRSRNGIPPSELAHDLGITPKSAGLMIERIRKAMANEAFTRFVEKCRKEMNFSKSQLPLFPE